VSIFHLSLQPLVTSPVPAVAEKARRKKKLTVLNVKIILAKFFNPLCKAFRRIAYDCEIFQTLVINVDGSDVTIVNINPS
jgi:hypothetical protein